MSRTFRLIAAILALTSCGQKHTGKSIVVDHELEQFARSFENDIGVSTAHISMVFAPLEGNTVGLCTSWSNGDREITIDPEFWQHLDYVEKEQLMYHELGHCALNLGHNDTMVLDPNTNINIEASIMNSYFFGNDYNWSSYRLQYKEALKHNTTILF